MFKYPFNFSKKYQEENSWDWIVEWIAATNDKDLQNHIIETSALKDASKDLEWKTVLFNHDQERPIGVVMSSNYDEKEKWIIVKIKISKEEGDIWKKINDWTLNSLSISGEIEDAKEWEEVLKIKKMKLSEVSIVSLPANPEAKTLNYYISKSLNNMKNFKKEMSMDVAITELNRMKDELNWPDAEVAGYIAMLLEQHKQKMMWEKMEEEETEETKTTETELSEKESTVYLLDSEWGLDESDKGTFRKQVLRIGKFFHKGAKNGILNITKQSLEKIIKNFKNKVIDNVSVPITHTSDPAMNTGEVKDLILTETWLDAILEIKDKSITKKINKWLIQAVSASIEENYEDKETGKKMWPVIRHVALVSEPYIKKMSAFQAVSLSDAENYNLVYLEEEEKVEEQIEEIKEEPKEDLKYVINKLMEKVSALEAKFTESPKEETPKEEAKAESDVVESKEEEKIETKEEEIKEEPKEEDWIKEAFEKAKQTEKEEKQEEEEDEETELSDTKALELSEREQELVKKEAEITYNNYLTQGKITPSQKDVFISILTSKTWAIDLADNSQADPKSLIKEFLDKQPKIYDFNEIGTTLENEAKNHNSVNLSRDERKLLVETLWMTEKDALETVIEARKNK